MTVKVEPVMIVHADGKEQPTEYCLYVYALTEHRFKSREQAERVAKVTEQAIRKAIEA